MATSRMFFLGAIVVLLTLCGIPRAGQAATALQLTGGDHQYCARTTAGSVFCWGRNNVGQLGNGNTSNSAVPVQVTNLPLPVTQISGGPSHTCALLADASVRCWGANANGQLGDGSLTNRSTPVLVNGLGGFDGAIAVSAGYKHSCALLASGRIKCWGSNVEGQLGNGNNINSTAPVEVLGIANARVLSAGTSHTCAALQTGTVKCWGYGGYGQLGNGATANRNTQVDVLNLTDVDTLVTGIQHTCAKTNGGGVKCWGDNSRGQLGNGSFSGSSIPVDVVGLAGGVSQLASTSASYSNCAILVGGGGKCWGANGNWQLGSGDNLNKNVPTTITGLSSPPQFITIGWANACAGVSNGVQCRGTLNSFGEHGAGNSTSVTFPQNTVGFVGGGPAFKPEPISPVTSNSPVYTWKAVPGATSYRLRINGVTTAYTAAAVNCPNGVGLCTFKSGYLTPGVYSWQVQSFNDYGDGEWSDVIQFLL